MKRRGKQTTPALAGPRKRSRPLSPGSERIRRVVSKIPAGRVMTYGEVARAAGMAGAARQVGYAMHSLGKSLPWQRVLGRKSARAAHITINDPAVRDRQQRLLESEGVRFSKSGSVDLETFGWAPRAPVPASAPPTRAKARNRAQSPQRKK